MYKTILILLSFITYHCVYSQKSIEHKQSESASIDHAIKLSDDNYVDTNKQNKSVEYDSSKVNPNNYGGSFSLGVSFGGGGIIGMPIRIYPAENFAMDLIVGLRGMIIKEHSNTTLDLNTYYTFGFDIFLFKHYIPAKHIVIKHGPFVKAGQSFDVRFSSTLGGCGWNYEHYRILKQSFNVELGAGLLRMHDKEYDPNNPNNPYHTNPEGWVHNTEEIYLFWKVGWNFF